MTAAVDELAVDGDRLLRRLDDLAAVGSTGDGGVSRLALTDDDRAGRDLVVEWMEDLDLEVSVDRIGNIVGSRSGLTDGPPVMTGSHVDTVATGGRYDGNLGVLAGLEVVETLVEAGVTTQRPLAVGVFTDEEGSRFSPDMLGSLVYVGGMTLAEGLDARSADGVRLGDELQRIGYAGVVPVPRTAPAAFVELHIEQGPVLETEGFTIGAVTGVQGISWQRVLLTGQANHAGTTPMHLRRDAGYVAAAIATGVRRIALERGGGTVATVGSLGLDPDLVNVVARRAELTIDLRHPDERELRLVEAAVAELVAEVAATEGVEVAIERLARFEPVVFDETIVDLVAGVAADRDLPVRRMVSGAGHDAQMLARVCPTGMIFVPSHDGISHNPVEHTDPDDLVAGADVLLHTLLILTDTRGPGRVADGR
jgi:N-carbamoyl-L-amino-acid hydrolase